MTSAGDLRERVGFYRREIEDDGAGNVQGAFGTAPAFVVWAQVRPRLGGEGVFAARLQGKNAVNITVRRSASTLLVTTDWIAKNEQSGEVFNIRSIIDPDMKRVFLEMLCEKGVAV